MEDRSWHWKSFESGESPINQRSRSKAVDIDARVGSNKWKKVLANLNSRGTAPRKEWREQANQLRVSRVEEPIGAYSPNRNWRDANHPEAKSRPDTNFVEWLRKRDIGALKNFKWKGCHDKATLVAFTKWISREEGHYGIVPADNPASRHFYLVQEKGATRL